MLFITENTLSKKLNNSYITFYIGGSIGVEYIHIPDRAQCDWIRERIETPEPFKYSVEEKRVILDRLTWSDSFERFVASKYPSEKRFGLEGGETLIPGMKAMVSFFIVRIIHAL
jgi:2-oxoglutarate dehydrogenase complex dehydrogenase (E1) component-like enzyme